MIHDATVEVTCDAEGCMDCLTIELPFVYPDYSGENGRYDHRDAAVNKLVRREDWAIENGTEDSRHFCPECAGGEDLTTKEEP